MEIHDVKIAQEIPIRIDRKNSRLGLNLIVSHFDNNIGG